MRRVMRTLHTNRDTLPPLADDDECLKPSEVMAILKCQKSFVYAAMRRGDLAFTRVGADLRVRRGDLRAYIHRRRVAREDLAC